MTVEPSDNVDVVTVQIESPVSFDAQYLSHLIVNIAYPQPCYIFRV